MNISIIMNIHTVIDVIMNVIGYLYWCLFSDLVSSVNMEVVILFLWNKLRVHLSTTRVVTVSTVRVSSPSLQKGSRVSLVNRSRRAGRLAFISNVSLISTTAFLYFLSLTSHSQSSTLMLRILIMTWRRMCVCCSCRVRWWWRVIIV
jgi:hypothetical protein